MGEVHRVEIPPVVTGPEAPVKGERPPSSPQGQPQDKSKETQQGQPKGQTAERPAYVPEKFWKDGQVDVEGMAKSYAELEKTKGKPQAGTDLSVKNPADEKEKQSNNQPNGERTPKAGEQQPAGEATQTSIPGVTKDQSARYWSELTEGGTLSTESYAELEKAGYPKAVVDQYIKGIQAEKTTQLAEATEFKKLAGGENGYAAMSEWMVANLKPEELAEYNEAVSSGKRSIIKLAVESMHRRYSDSMGNPPNLLGGRGNAADAGDVFQSQAEVTAAMRDPRYRRDEAYRRSVAEKIARSRKR